MSELQALSANQPFVDRFSIDNTRLIRWLTKLVKVGRLWLSRKLKNFRPVYAPWFTAGSPARAKGDSTAALRN